MLYTSDRYFQLWDYNVSHKQMLLRSPETPNIAMNIDVVMWGVEYIELVPTLKGLVITSPSHDEIKRVELVLGKTDDLSRVHCFASGGSRFIVVTAGFKVLKNNLDIFQSSLEYFVDEDPPRELGEILFRT